MCEIYVWNTCLMYGGARDCCMKLGPPPTYFFLYNLYNPWPRFRFPHVSTFTPWGLQQRVICAKSKGNAPKAAVPGDTLKLPIAEFRPQVGAGTVRCVVVLQFLANFSLKKCGSFHSQGNNSCNKNLVFVKTKLIQFSSFPFKKHPRSTGSSIFLHLTVILSCSRIPCFCWCDTPRGHTGPLEVWLFEKSPRGSPKNPVFSVGWKNPLSMGEITPVKSIYRGYIYNTLEVQPPFLKGWFPNHHYFSRGLSSSKRNHHFWNGGWLPGYI